MIWIDAAWVFPLPGSGMRGSEWNIRTSFSANSAKPPTEASTRSAFGKFIIEMVRQDVLQRGEGSELCAFAADARCMFRQGTHCRFGAGAARLELLQNFDQRRHIVGQLAFEAKLGAGDRVLEAEH